MENADGLADEFPISARSFFKRMIHRQAGPGKFHVRGFEAGRYVTYLWQWAAPDLSLANVTKASGEGTIAAFL